MGQIMSVIGQEYHNLEFMDNGELEIIGPCAFDILFTKSVPHILEMIFFSLDYESYWKCLEVNKMWKELLTSESYQTKGKIVFRHDIFALEKKLWKASHDGDVLKVRQLISCPMVNVNCFMDCREIGLETNCVIYSGEAPGHYTPLHEAAYCGHTEVIKVLLDGGADPNMETGWGWTALIVAVQFRKENVIRILTSRGADPNKPNKRGVTPLLVAADWGRNHAVNVLLGVGAELNKAYLNGDTPLHRASGNCHIETVKLLLQKGADPTITNENGETPLSFARQSWPDNGSKLEMVNILQFHVENM